jgi:hypothetical protein
MNGVDAVAKDDFNTLPSTLLSHLLIEVVPEISFKMLSTKKHQCLFQGF